MRKLFLLILLIVPFGIFAQQTRYVTTPTPKNTASRSVESKSSKDTTNPVPKELTYKSHDLVTTKDSLIRRDFFRDELRTSDKYASQTTFIKNGFWDNWYLSVGGGLGLLMSEESRYVGVLDAAKPTISLAIGKWVTPIVGFRVSATAAQLQGFAIWNYDQLPNGELVGWGHGAWYCGVDFDDAFSFLYDRAATNTYLDATYGRNHRNLVNMNGEMVDAGMFVSKYIENTFFGDARESSKGPGFEYDMKYAAASLEGMLNITNLFDRYRPNRFLNLNLFAGVGCSHTFEEKGRTSLSSIMGKTGLEMTFRLSKQMTFNIEPNILILPEVFDRRVGDDQTQDLVFNALAGFTYRFRERNFYEPVYRIEKIIETNTIINEARQESCEDLRRRLEENCPDLLKSPVVDVEHLNVVVHFIIDKWEVRTSEMYKLDEVARFMEKYPRVRVTVAGYADVQTAYPAYNLKLSDRRAKEVARILTTKYGIDKTRLKVERYGDTVQPFNVNELNRAVIAFDIPED